MPPPTAPWGWRPTTASWTRNGATAASIAADRPALWAPGALASIAFLGWLPFVLSVTALPTPGDLAFLTANLATASSFPFNVILLAASGVAVILTASILVAAGEAALQQGIDRILGRDAAERPMDDVAGRLWIVQLVAALPAIAALTATVLGIAAVAPGEYQSPDIGGPLVFRIVRDVWPLAAMSAAALVVGIAFGAAAQRATRRPGSSLGGALAEGVRAVLRHPVRRLALALATLALLGAWLAATWALLHLLWVPIGRDLAEGRLLEAGMPLLLVGFVAIWLCLIAAGGALHGWASAWWSLELSDQ